MADTRQVLERISAFKARLEQMPLLLTPSDPSALKPHEVSQVVNRIAGFIEDAPPPQPVKLTARATRLLTEARDLITQQKQLLGDTAMLHASGDPLSKFHRGTVGLTDAALRLATAFPAAAEAQLRMCDGFEQMLHVIRHRLGVMNHAMALKRSDHARIAQLANLLAAVHDGRAVYVEQIMEVAEVLLDDARQGARMRFHHIDAKTAGVPMAVAAHAINVGQVLARLANFDFEWASKPSLLVFAGLVMDVGMLDLSADAYLNCENLTGDDLRVYEAHPRRSADLVRTRLPETGPLADVIVAHHERIDGTGFPNGFRNDTIPGASRFLAVADLYAKLNEDRPNAQGDPRSALTETLLAAEQGHLDRDFAEYLLNLSFFPVGTIVELNSGRLAVVVATNNNRASVRASMRPVVAILTDAEEHALPRPEFVDLSATQVGSIVRAVPRTERIEKLSEWYPDLCI